MRVVATLPLVALLAAGCQAAKEPLSPEYEVSQVRFAPPGAEGATGPEALPLPPSRKLIRTVDLDLRVDDPDAAADQIRELAAEAGGYVAEVNAYRREELLHYRISIRIPADELDAVVDAVKLLAVEVEHEHLRTEDVTEKFVDLEARLRTLRLTEGELQALLADARSQGSKADEIIAIYRHLTEIRTSIEQLQGQLNALDSLITYSTVNLELTPTEAARPLVTDRWRPSETVRGSVRALVGSLEVIADLAIMLVIVVVPIALLVVLIVWLTIKAFRKVQARGGRR